MWLVGLAVGRWWAVPAGALGWAGLVMLSVSVTASDLLVAAALGAANVAVGVLMRWSVARVVRGVTRLASRA